MGQDPYGMLRIPPGIWYGFQGISSDQDSVIVNCADMAHNPTEVVRLDATSPEIPYTWKNL